MDLIDELYRHRCRENSFHQEVVRHLEDVLNTWSIASDAHPGHVGKHLLACQFRSAPGMQFRLVALELTGRTL